MMDDPLVQKIIFVVNKVVYICGLFFIALQIITVLSLNDPPLPEEEVFGTATNTMAKTDEDDTSSSESDGTEDKVASEIETPRTEQAIAKLKRYTPKDVTAIDVIIESYYALILPSGNNSEYSIFTMASKRNASSFFSPFLPDSMDDEERMWMQNQIFKAAFFEPFTPAWDNTFSSTTRTTNGGEVVGRKLLSPDTMLVYSKYIYESYPGAAVYLCKESGIQIDKWTFKKVGDEWKVAELEENIDSWISHNEGNSEEACKEINQEKILKYQIGGIG